MYHRFRLSELLAQLGTMETVAHKEQATTQNTSDIDLRNPHSEHASPFKKRQRLPKDMPVAVIEEYEKAVASSDAIAGTPAVSKARGNPWNGTTGQQLLSEVRDMARR